MSASGNTGVAPARKAGATWANQALTRGAAVIYLSLIVLIPLAAVV